MDDDSEVYSDKETKYRQEGLEYLKEELWVSLVMIRN